MPETALAIDVGEGEDVAVRRLRVAIDIAHLGTAVDAKVVMLVVEGRAVVVVNHTAVGVVVSDDEVVVDDVGCRDD